MEPPLCIQILFGVALSHVGDKIEHLAAVAPFVVVPGDQLYESIVQHYAGVFIEYAGVAFAAHVAGNNLVAGEGDYALHGGAAGFLNGVAYFLISCGAAEARGKVNNAHVVGRHAEAHAGKLALKAGHDQRAGLCGAGGGGDYVVEYAPAGAPVAAGAGVYGLLLGCGGVYGGHKALLYAEVIVNNLGKGGYAVGGAAGVGNNVEPGVVFPMINAHNIGWGLLIFCGGAEHNLLRAVGQVAGGKLGGVERAGGFNYVFRAAAVPGYFLNIAAAENGYLAAVYAYTVFGLLHGAGETAEYGIVFHKINHVFGFSLAKVDAANFEFLRPFCRDAQYGPADPAETIDAKLDSHCRDILRYK